MPPKKSLSNFAGRTLRILVREPVCPVCTSIEFQLRPPHARDRLLKLVNLLPLQCTNCWRNFYWVQNDRASIGGVDRIQRFN
jgi:hypothetical protein